MVIISRQDFNLFFSCKDSSCVSTGCESLLADFPSSKWEEVDVWGHHYVCMSMFQLWTSSHIFMGLDMNVMQLAVTLMPYILFDFLYFYTM